MKPQSGTQEIRNLFQQVHAARPLLLFVLLFSFCANILLLVPPLYMLNVFDRVLASRSMETLVMLTLIMFFLMASYGFLEWSRQVLLNRISTLVHETISEHVFDLSFRQALLEPSAPNGQLMQDSQGFRRFIAGKTLLTIFDLPWTPVFVVIMFAFHPYFGLLAVGGMIMLFIITWFSERANRSKSVEAELLSSRVNAFAARAMFNAEVAFSMGMVERIKAIWKNNAEKANVLQVEAGDVAGKYSALARTFRITIQSTGIGLGAYLAITDQITPGMLIAGTILMGKALSPIDQLISGWQAFLSARGQATRLNAALKLASDLSTESMNLPPPEGKLSADQITVTVPGTKQPVLNNITLQIQPGSQIGIFGQSGAGKSTLAKALLGLMPLSQGTVRLDGADLKQWDRNRLGPYLGYLPQDVELFDGTIAENIARFEEIDEYKVIEAAKKTGVHQLILNLSQGYDSPVRQVGGLLSGGQRQRLGLARAIYGNPRIVILDEPNANLDQDGEQALINLTKTLKAEGTTLIIIAHRPNILLQMDHVIVLHNGMIADFGASDAILKKHLKVLTTPPRCAPPRLKESSDASAT